MNSCFEFKFKYSPNYPIKEGILCYEEKSFFFFKNINSLRSSRYIFAIDKQ